MRQAALAWALALASGFDPVSAGTPGAQAAQATIVGVVLPADGRPGEKVTGSIVTDPDAYDHLPGLRVERRTMRLGRAAGGGATLQGVVIDAGDAPAQPASRPFTAIVPPDGRVRLSLRGGEGSAATPVDVPFGGEPRATSTPSPARAGATAYETPALAVRGALQIVRGPFDGDAATTAIAIQREPAAVVAESARAVYCRVPETAPPGRAVLSLREGSVKAALPVVVVSLTLTADRLELTKGETTTVRAVIEGPEQLAADRWRAGRTPELVDEPRLSRLFPGSPLPDAGSPGQLLLRLENVSRDTVSFTPSDHDVVVKRLGREAFASGPYRFEGTIRSKRSGRFQLDAVLVPWLAPVNGEPVSNDDEGLPPPKCLPSDYRRALHDAEAAEDAAAKETDPEKKEALERTAKEKRDNANKIGEELGPGCRALVWEAEAQDLRKQAAENLRKAKEWRDKAAALRQEKYPGAARDADQQADRLEREAGDLEKKAQHADEEAKKAHEAARKQAAAVVQVHFAR